MGKRENKFLVLDADGKARIVTKTQMYEELLASERKRVDELRDAVEFEARVAELFCHFFLVDDLSPCMDDDNDNYPCRGRKPGEMCPWCRLRTARLKVEEEMDADH